MSSQGQSEPNRFFISTPGTVFNDVPCNLTLQIKSTVPQALISYQHRSPKMDPQFLAPQIHLWVADTAQRPTPNPGLGRRILKGAGTGARGESGGSAGSLGWLGTKRTGKGWRTPCTPSCVTNSDQAHQRTEAHH